MQRLLEQGIVAMSLAAAVNDQGPSARALYDKLEDRILARDQVGASESYYDLVRDGRPLPEMLREAVRIHGPYTHVPYHERIDDGFVNFVNNDHCLLSARATLHLSQWLPVEAAGLPMAQTIWYIPTGLDIWNQKINKADRKSTRLNPVTCAKISYAVFCLNDTATTEIYTIAETLFPYTTLFRSRWWWSTAPAAPAASSARSR